MSGPGSDMPISAEIESWDGLFRFSTDPPKAVTMSGVPGILK